MRTAYANGEVLLESTASPLYANYQSFVPLQFIVGRSKMLLDDSVLAANKARRAGVAVGLQVWDGMPHVFPLLSFLPESGKVIEKIASFVSRHTGWKAISSSA